MDDEEFDQVSEILFDGVTSIVKIGLPGIIIPMSNDTRAVLCGDNSFNVIIVAARVGQGRCLVFGHDGYTKLFTETEENKDQEQFINNCKQWISQESSTEILNINNIKAMDDIDTEDKILLWNGNNSKDEEFMDDLVLFYFVLFLFFSKKIYLFFLSLNIYNRVEDFYVVQQLGVGCN
jgi:hypothetical protein